jgi:hypothetical protein
MASLVSKRVIVLKPENVAQLVFFIRGEKVIFDADLAMLYGVEVRSLNQAVARNRKRFPADFAFQLTDDELAALRSQPVISNTGIILRLLETSLLQKITKFFYRHSGVFDYSAHRQRVHRIVTRYGNEMRTVAHDDVFALADNLKSCLFERLHCAEMIDAGKLRHR